MIFPGWDELQNTPAETIKRWLLSKRYGDDAQYLSVIQAQAGHRGPGDTQAQRAYSQAAPSPAPPAGPLLGEAARGGAGSSALTAPAGPLLGEAARGAAENEQPLYGEDHSLPVPLPGAPLAELPGDALEREGARATLAPLSAPLSEAHAHHGEGLAAARAHPEEREAPSEQRDEALRESLAEEALNENLAKELEQAGKGDGVGTRPPIDSGFGGLPGLQGKG